MNKKKNRKSKQRVHKTFIAAITTLILIIIVLIVGGYYYLLGFENSSNLGGVSVKSRRNINKNCENVLLLGVDVGDPTSQSAKVPKRTDTIMILNYNKDTKVANIVSIPRDTRVCMNGHYMKINAVHAIKGANGTKEEIEKLLGINIDNYVKLDYEAFRKIIDAIGGIDMDITRNMDYDDSSQNLHIHFRKGTNVHLDGRRAEEFFRWRKNNNGTGLSEGDLGRIKNQHLFIEKVIDKFKSPIIITQIPKILSTIPKYLDTDMTPDEIVKYGYSATRLNKETLKIQTLKGEARYVRGVSYFIYNSEKNKDVIYTLRTGQNSQSEDFINKSNVKIKILNGTNINGLAAKLAKRLNNMGYENIVTGNGDRTQESRLIYNKNKDVNVREIQESFNFKIVKKITKINDNFDIIILLGDNFPNNTEF